MPAQIAASIILLVMVAFSGLFAAAAFKLGPMASVFDAPTAQPLTPPSGFPVDQMPAPLPDVGSAFSTTARIIGGFGVVIGLLAIYGLLYIWRSGVWLEGTLVTRRGVLISRRADLTTAEVRMGVEQWTTTQQTAMYRTYTTYRVPALVISARRGVGSFKVPLRGRGLNLLPDWQLAALAGALAYNRGPDPARAHAIGAHLHGLSRDPLAY
jgi:hypothetical protein